jgi:hypothetical protein
MNKGMQEDRHEPVQHLRVLINFFACTLYVLYGGSWQIGVVIVRRRKDEALECFIRGVVAKVFRKKCEIRDIVSEVKVRPESLKQSIAFASKPLTVHQQGVLQNSFR